MQLFKTMFKNSILIGFILTSLFGFSQTKDLKDVSVDALMTETQFSSDNPDKMEMIWYMPSSFWEISMLQDPSMTAEDAMNMVELTKDYELVAVVQGNIGNFGGITYEPLEKLRSDITVTYAGEKLQLLDKDDYSPDLSSFLSIMKPMLVNMFGPMGENMHFMVFNSSEDNLLPIDLTSNHDFKIALDGFNAELNLPLNSLLKEKKCPVDGAFHSGKWEYCPYHGKKLVKE